MHTHISRSEGKALRKGGENTPDEISNVIDVAHDGVPSGQSPSLLIPRLQKKSSGKSSPRFQLQASTSALPLTMYAWRSLNLRGHQLRTELRTHLSVEIEQVLSPLHDVGFPPSLGCAGLLVFFDVYQVIFSFCPSAVQSSQACPVPLHLANIANPCTK